MQRARRSRTVATPLLEDRYNLEDALVAGSIPIALLRHADRVKIACLAQPVNVIAPIMTVTCGGSWRQGLTHFAANRDLEDDLLLECDLRVFRDYRLREHIVLAHDDPKVVNDEENDTRVAPHYRDGAAMDAGILTASLPRLSWNMIRLVKTKE